MIEQNDGLIEKTTAKTDISMRNLKQLKKTPRPKMSRRPRAQVWFQWFGLAEVAICPVCGKQKIQKDAERR